jgi:Leucine-rich repeat (LRR) protein
LKLKVYERGSEDTPDRVLGFTPASAKHRITLPVKRLWYVQPLGALNKAQLAKLGEEIRKKGIPGLDLSDHWELTDTQLPSLGELPNLKMVVFARTRLADASLAHVAHWKSLEMIALGESVTDAGLAQLKDLRRLRDVNLDRVRLTDAGVGVLLGFKDLERLDLSSTGISADGLKRLASLPRLKHLVANGSLNDQNAAAISKFAALEELDVTQTELAAEGYAAFSSLRRLHTLYASRSLTDRALDAIAKIPNLRTLDLSGAQITDAGLAKLRGMKQLRELGLTDTQVSDAGIRALAALPQLRVLEVSQTRVTSAGLASLAKLRTLETVSLSWDRLGKRDVENLAHLTQLQSILLNGVALPDEVLRQMKGLTKLPPAGLVPLNRDLALSAPVAPPVAPLQTDIDIQARRHQSKTPAQRKQEEALAMAWVPSGKPRTRLPSASVPPPTIPAPTPQNIPAPAPREVAGAAPSAPRPMAAPMKSAKIPAGDLATPRLTDRAAPAQIRTETDLERPSDLALQAGAKPTAGGAKPAQGGADEILEKILVHAKSAPRKPVPRISSLRHLKSSESTLGDVIPGSRQNITMPEDKPENYLGDITIDAGTSKSKGR